MQNKIEIIKKEIKSLEIASNIVCLILYGSVTTNAENPDDLDGIIVVKEITPALDELFYLLKLHFTKLDFNIYSKYEVENNISYFTREFKLEYLAKGLCILGENIFMSIYSLVTEKQYKFSLLVRSIEHLQLVRQKYFFGLKSEEEKYKYLKKYLVRISKNILLFYGKFTHTTVNELTDSQVFKELYVSKVFDRIIVINSVTLSKDLLTLFSFIENALYRMRKEI